MHLKQSGFAHSACGLFTKSKEGIQNYKETRHLRYFFGNELEKPAFNMIWLAYGYFKDLTYKNLIEHYGIKHLFLLQ